MPRRILVLGSYAPSLINFRGPLIAAMVAHGHEVVAAAPDVDRNTAAALERIGAAPRSVPLSNASLSPLGLLRSLRAVRALVRQERPDLIFSYTIKPVILGALAGRAERVGKVVSLITGLGFAFTGGREPKRLVARAAATLLYRIAMSKSDLVLFQNRDDEALFRTLRLLRQGQQAHVLNGSGVDLVHFAQAPLPPDPSFLMIARLLRDKGIREYAEAAKRLKAFRPDVRIGLVGYLDPSPDSMRQEELDQLVRAGITFHGRLQDVRPAIADYSVYVLPSYREGTPRSVLEAMAMGRAIITTDAPGCRDTVEPGRNGALIPPRDADALYRAMLEFVEAPAVIAQMGTESRRLAEERYDVNRVNEAVLRYAGL